MTLITAYDSPPSFAQLFRRKCFFVIVFFLQFDVGSLSLSPLFLCLKIDRRARRSLSFLPHAL